MAVSSQDLIEGLMKKKLVEFLSRFCKESSIVILGALLIETSSLRTFC